MCRLITHAELEALSTRQLHVLYGQYSRMLPRTRPGSTARANVIGSLQNIARVLRCRPRPPGPC